MIPAAIIVLAVAYAVLVALVMTGRAPEVGTRSTDGATSHLAAAEWRHALERLQEGSPRTSPVRGERRG